MWSYAGPDLGQDVAQDQLAQDDIDELDFCRRQIDRRRQNIHASRRLMDDQMRSSRSTMCRNRPRLPVLNRESSCHPDRAVRLPASTPCIPMLEMKAPHGREAFARTTEARSPVSGMRFVLATS
jgi:hypothetical protein